MMEQLQKICSRLYRFCWKHWKGGKIVDLGEIDLHVCGCCCWVVSTKWCAQRGLFMINTNAFTCTFMNILIPETLLYPASIVSLYTILPVCACIITLYLVYTCLYIIYVIYGYEYSDTQSDAAVLYLVLKASDVSIF